MSINTAKSTKIFKLLFRLSVLSLIISIFSQMIIANKLAVKSSELVTYQNRKAELEKELISLEFENSRVSTLAYVESQANALGFVKMTESVVAIKDPTTAAAVNLR